MKAKETVSCRRSFRSQFNHSPTNLSEILISIFICTDDSHSRSLGFVCIGQEFQHVASAPDNHHYSSHNLFSNSSVTQQSLVNFVLNVVQTSVFRYACSREAQRKALNLQVVSLATFFQKPVDLVSQTSRLFTVFSVSRRCVCSKPRSRSPQNRC